MKAQEFIKPQKGVLIRDPMNMSFLSKKGEYKPMIGREGIYWRRRLKDGSIIIATVEKKEKQNDKVEDENPPISGSSSKTQTRRIDK
ncbi:DUF2635 domain-containing protein [Candidatus Pacearchaeota archaeon]|nr:DUF2635 domain-containing protein [Candidatus Pacearchaeota archaeon]